MRVRAARQHPTNTAEVMAALRAAGAVGRDPAVRNPDYMAGAFLSAQLRVHALAKVPGARRLIPLMAERLLPGGYYYEIARVKHIDAILRSELRHGLDQLVILGAGYDSRAYRFADTLRAVRVYEIDLPPISVVKRRKVTAILDRPPDNVAYITADFVRDDLSERLRERAYDLRAATLFVLSGVAPYLPRGAVDELFRFVANHTCARTSIAFDYVFDEMLDGDDSFRGAAQTRQRLAALGEPFKFGIPIGGVAQFVESYGLKLTSDLQPNELARRYLRRADGTIERPYGFVAVAHARVDTAAPPRSRAGG